MSYNSTNTGAEIQAKLDKVVLATTTTDGLMSSTDKTKLDNIGEGAKDNVFWATYGTTTATELEAAYQAGKVILVKRGNFIYTLTDRYDSTKFGFGTVAYEYSGYMSLSGLSCENSSWGFWDSAGATQFADLNRNTYYSSVTTLASVPTTYRLVLATLSAATTLSLATDLTAGQELHIICTPTASFTQPIPNSGSWISMDGSSLTVTSGVPFELNILFDGTYYRVKVITQAS